MKQVADEIVALRASDGRIYPATIVEWARQHPGSSLHGHFEWDVELAAHEHWLSQARRLIAVHVVDAAGDRQTISLVPDRVGSGGYRDLPSVLSSAEMRRSAVDQALAELRRWRDRHGFLERELGPVFRAIERIAPAARDVRDAA